MSPARACAYAVLRRVFESGAYADRALQSQAMGLDRRDRALATALVYTTVQRRATLDHVIERLAGRSPEQLDPPVLAALRLGLAQLLLLDGIAEHAAVHESVELAKSGGGGGAGLVNAVLRRATREGREILAALGDDTPAQAAILHSVPLWLAELWWRELGPQVARELLRHINRPAESALRVNSLVAEVTEVAASLGVRSHPAPGVAQGLVLDEPFDVHGSPLWARGAIMAQSRGSMLAGLELGARPGERVLDLCAAPGAKTTQLAALMKDEGELNAVERHPGRAQALQRTLARMQVGCAEVRVANAAAWSAPSRSAASSSVAAGSAASSSAASSSASGYDRVLVDPPCSGLGTLQSRPDLRWRTSPARIAALAALQAQILAAGAAATRQGGTLLYSVCTISQAEGERVIERFLAEHHQFRAEPLGAGTAPWRQLLPHRDGTDGFFIARLRRE